MTRDDIIEKLSKIDCIDIIDKGHKTLSRLMLENQEPIPVEQSIFKHSKPFPINCPKLKYNCNKGGA